MYIKVRVYPKSKKEILQKKDENQFVIFVKEKAEKNSANKRILEVLSTYFEVELSKLRIVNGHHNPSKLISIDL